MQWARADLNYGDTTDTTGGIERTTSSTSGNTFGLKQKTWFKLHSRVESSSSCSVPGSWSSDVQCFTGVCDMSATKLSKTFSVGPCTATVTAAAKDVSDGSGGTYKETSSTSNSHTYDFDDNPGSADCDMDIRIKNTWTIAGDDLNILSSDNDYDAQHNILGGYILNLAGSRCTIGGAQAGHAASL